jgi:hypothetical protein
VRLPLHERRTRFTAVQKGLALLAALAAGCRCAREGDFMLAPDPATPADLSLPRRPHSSRLTRHLGAFATQHVAALRAAFEEVLATDAAARRRLRRAERLVDLDQTPFPASGRTNVGTAKGHVPKKGSPRLSSDRGLRRRRRGWRGGGARA